MEFAGFLMTYNRHTLILNTIENIFNQTVPPEHLLIVDNSDNSKTRDLIEGLNDPKVEHLPMQDNLGPAGASKVGISVLISRGYKWIYWGDDDDPPKFNDEFENLLNLARQNKEIAAIGSVGARFNRKTGLMERLIDEECLEVVDCDVIGGNHNMILNANILRKTKILPNDDLFFGFEEFEFLRRIKLAGYRVVVSGKSLLRLRARANRLNIKVQSKLNPRADYKQLKREYYSYRNLIYSYLYTFKYKDLAFKMVLRALAKIPFGYLKGFNYGNKNAQFMIMSIFDALSKSLGKRY